METTTFELPAMYADHHVLEVRRILLETPGVEDVYASSAFHVVEVTFDPEKTDVGALVEALDKAGYAQELPVAMETGVPVTESNGNPVYFRHTAAYEQTSQVVGFEQAVETPTKPLWPCPGMGPIRTMDE